MTLAVGVDLGGTKIAAGLVDVEGTILAQGRRETPSSPDAAADAIASLVKELDAGDAPVGIGAAGFVDASRREVLFAPNLGWVEVPFADLVASRVGSPVVMENDANAAAWAESRFGAGAAVRSLVLITVGTGIGGGIVLDHALVRGGFGIAGEFGHVPLVADGRLCGCGQRGCWEQYASGNALTRSARSVAAVGGPGAKGLLAACAGRPEELTGSDVATAAAAGDPAAIGVLAEIGTWLGHGLAAVAAMLDPEVIVVGGGVVSNGDLLLAPAREEFRRRLPAAEHRPVADIRPATLGPAAGLVGAADLARLVAR